VIPTETLGRSPVTMLDEREARGLLADYGVYPDGDHGALRRSRGRRGGAEPHGADRCAFPDGSRVTVASPIRANKRTRLYAEYMPRLTAAGTPLAVAMVLADLRREVPDAFEVGECWFEVEVKRVRGDRRRLVRLDIAKRRRTRHDPDTLTEAAHLLARGASYREVAAATGLSASTCSDIFEVVDGSPSG